MANTIDTDAKIIVADQFGFGQPTLCRCSSTLMFAAHINDSSQLEIHKSIDDGVNWSLVKTFSESDPGDFELAAIDATSAAIVFLYGLYVKVYVTVNSGSTWTQKWMDETVTYKANIAYDSMVEHRLWICYRVGSSTFRFKYSDNKGDNWTTKEHNIGLLYEVVSDIDINPYNGDIFAITIRSGGTGLCRIYKCDKNGNYIGFINLSGNYNFDGCIVFDSNGNYMVIEGHRYNYPSYLFSLGASRNGGSFVNLIPGEAGLPWVKGSVSVAVDGDDNFYAFYTKVSDEKTYYRKWNGSIWESEVILVGIANDRISCEKRPIAGSNRLHFVYYKAP